MDAERLQLDGPGRGLLSKDELPESVLILGTANPKPS